MKFNSLYHTKVKTMNIANFGGGLNLADLPENISDTQLTQCKNMVFSKGLLKTRKGIQATEQNVIESDAQKTILSENDFLIADELCKIAVTDKCLDDSYHICNIYFINADGISKSAGNLEFYRTDNETFYEPFNFTFYKGKKQNGGGIFLFLTKKNRYVNDAFWYQIYEINDQMNGWEQVNNFYTPTVYINGRGTKYEEAKFNLKAYTGKPTELESPNLLNGRFIAYYSSDYYSSCFRLPYSNLADELVTCRIYTSINSYTEWSVNPGSNSDTKSFFNVEVTFNIDKEKGIFYFTSEDSSDYPIPITSTYQQNNIKITAEKVIENGFNSVVSSNCCTVVGDKTLFSGGNNKGEIYVVSNNNPLYFPQNSKAVLGGSDTGITALINRGNEVTAFKNDQTYSLTFKEGKALNTASLLSDNDSIFYEGDKITASIISKEIGCPYKYTIKTFNDKLIWLGNDKRIYYLNLNTKKYQCISIPINPYFENITNDQLAFSSALNINGGYCLFILNKALFLNTATLTETKKSWFPLEFGEIKILGGISNIGKESIICLGSDDKVIYTACFSGETDTNICINDNLITKKEEKIFSAITTKHFTLNSVLQPKIIESVFLTLSSAGNVEFDFNHKRFDSINLNSYNIDSGCNTLKSVRLIPHLNATTWFSIGVSSSDGLTLGETAVYYRNCIK